MPPWPTGPGCQEGEQHGRTKLPGQFGKPKVDGTCAVLISSCEKCEWFTKQAGSSVLIVTWKGLKTNPFTSPKTNETSVCGPIHQGPQPLLELYTATSHQRDSWIRLYFQAHPPLRRWSWRTFYLLCPRLAGFLPPPPKCRKLKANVTEPSSKRPLSL